MQRLRGELDRKALERRVRYARDSELGWRIQEQDRRIFRHYRRGMRALEDLLRRTTLPETPWQRIESLDDTERSLAATTVLRDALAQRARAPEEYPPPAGHPSAARLPIRAPEARAPAGL